VEKKGMIKWLGENGGEFVGTKKKDLCVQIRFLCRLHKFIGDALVEAQECYGRDRCSVSVRVVHCKLHVTRSAASALSALEPSRKSSFARDSRPSISSFKFQHVRHKTPH
jgi:hypothetical protein